MKSSIWDGLDGSLAVTHAAFHAAVAFVARPCEHHHRMYDTRSPCHFATRFLLENGGELRNEASALECAQSVIQHHAASKIESTEAHDKPSCEIRCTTTKKSESSSVPQRLGDGGAENRDSIRWMAPTAAHGSMLHRYRRSAPLIGRLGRAVIATHSHARRVDRPNDLRIIIIRLTIDRGMDIAAWLPLIVLTEAPRTEP